MVGLVYIAAFGLDEGESLGALLEAGPPPPTSANLGVDDQGFAWLPEDDFVGHFAADVDPSRRASCLRCSCRCTPASFGEAMGVPAWRSLPCWYMVVQHDDLMPPGSERRFAARMRATTVEVAASHVPMVSGPPMS